MSPVVTCLFVTHDDMASYVHVATQVALCRRHTRPEEVWLNLIPRRHAEGGQLILQLGATASTAAPAIPGSHKGATAPVGGRPLPGHVVVATREVAELGQHLVEGLAEVVRQERVQDWIDAAENQESHLRV